MNRICMIVTAGALASLAMADSLLAREIEIVGVSEDGPKWTWMKQATPDEAEVGNPKGRLRVKVKNGDVVRFVLKDSGHDVLFENAVPEMKAGVWEVVKGSGELLVVDGLPDFFNADNCRATDKGEGKLIEIRIKKLAPGDKSGRARE